MTYHMTRDMASVCGILPKGLMEAHRVSPSLKTIGGVENTKKNLPLMSNNNLKTEDRKN